MDLRRFLPDVVMQFRSLNERGERIAVMHGFGSEFADKRYSVFHKKGGKNNHFQGVQRLGNHLLVTGSFPYSKKRSDLLVFRLDSRVPDPGPWGSNLMRDRDPPPADRLVNYFRIDPEFWHPGGLALLGSIAAVPLENSEAQSKVVFLDLSAPAAPVRISPEIARREHKAGALAITMLADGRRLLAVWSDSDRPHGGAVAPYHLDLYLADPPGTVWRLIAHFFPADDHRCHCKFQSLDFVWERTADGAETLFLIGFENTSEAQPNPLDPGENLALLFRVDLDLLLGAAADPPPRMNGDWLEFIDDRHFATSGNWCNMDAGACAYVDENQQLIIYSVYHFLAPIRGAKHTTALVLKCLEFRATRFGAPIFDIEDAWLDLHDEAGLLGRRLALLGPFDSSVEDTAHVHVDDRTFDVAASVRYQLPDDRAFVLYPDPGFAGAPPLVLTGDGDVKEVDILATGFGGAFRSCRLQRESVAVALPGAIVV